MTAASLIPLSEDMDNSFLIGKPIIMGFFHLPCCNFQPGSFGCPCFSPDQSWYEKHSTRTDATLEEHLTTLQGYDLFCCSKGALDIFSSNTMMALAPVADAGTYGILLKKSYEKHIFLYGSYICAHRQFWNDTCVYLQLRHGKQLQIGQAWWRSRKQTTNFPTCHNLQNFYYTCSAIKSYPEISQFSPVSTGPAAFAICTCKGRRSLVPELRNKPEKLFIFQNVMLHPTKVQ